MRKLLLTNVAYWSQKFQFTYPDILLNCQLNSLLDDTNIPEMLRSGYEIKYHLFCDPQTEIHTKSHKNWIRLLQTIGANNVSVEVFDFRGGIDRFDYRYNVLCKTLVPSIKLALEQNSLVAPWVADLCVAKHFLPRVLRQIERGHDSVFVLPARSAAEGSMIPTSTAEGALSDLDLWRVCYDNLHPLWLTCHYGNKPFTDKPFALLWNSGRGLLAHSYSVTPIVFKPKPEMLKTERVIDIEIPGMCERPYWAHDWTDAPVIGVEPLASHWPVFDNSDRSSDWIRDFAEHLDPFQHKALREELYFPSKEYSQFDEEVVHGAKMVSMLLTRTPGDH